MCSMQSRMSLWGFTLVVLGVISLPSLVFSQDDSFEKTYGMKRKSRLSKQFYPNEIQPLFKSKPTKHPNPWEHSPLFENSECGANALYVMLKLCGSNVDRDVVHSVVPIEERGASMLDLKNGAKQLGVPVNVVEGSLEEIISHTPGIIRLGEVGDKDIGHYVVLTEYQEIDGNGFVSAVDGSTGMRYMISIDSLADQYSGFGIIRKKSISLREIGLSLVCLVILIEIVCMGILARRLLNAKKLQSPPEEL